MGIGTAIVLSTLLYFLGYITSAETLFVYSIILVIYALVPDCDIKSTSMIVVYSLIIAVISYLLFIEKDYRTAAFGAYIALFPNVTKHRGVMHNWLTGAVLSGALLLLFFDWFIVLYAYVGFLTHLFADSKLFRR